jgi:hypothetical protein
MQRVVFFAVLAVLSFAADTGRAVDTAYQALRTLGAQQGQGILSRVIEVRGSFGAPQPLVWAVLVDEPNARGGVREFEISKGKVISERTPVRPASIGSVMNFQLLNLDSEGVFTVANQEASKAGVGFDFASYTLRSREGQGTPIWIVELFTRKKRFVGALHVSADNGQILRSEGLGSGRRVPPPQESERPRQRDGDEEIETDADRNVVEKAAHSFHKFLRRGAATVQEKVTGKRTLDRRYQNEP